MKHRLPPVFANEEKQVSVQFSQHGMSALPANFAKPRSSFLQTLLRARDDDAAKQRIRKWLMALDDQQLSRLGLPPEDIALLRFLAEQRTNLRAPDAPAAPQPSTAGGHCLA
jgi:hypothetical protein